MDVAPDALAYVCVQTRSGPHVTPQVVASAGGLLWTATTRRSLKARVIERDPAVAALIRGGSTATSIRAKAVLLDPLQPLRVLRSLPTAVLAAPGALAYGVQNPEELLTTARDILASRIGGGDLDVELRVLVALEPLTVVDAPPAGGSVLGWGTADGVAALPAEWDMTTHRARVDGRLFSVLGCEERSAACVTTDVSRGRSAGERRGVMVRGAGRAVRAGDLVTVELDVRKATWWDGGATGTVVVEQEKAA